MRSDEILAYIIGDRRWKRSQRLHHAEFAFKRAKEAGDRDQVAFWREILKANAYDYQDKILNLARKEAQREAELKAEAEAPKWNENVKSA